MHGKKINRCRLCKSKKIQKVIDFGKIPLGNNLLKNKRQSLRVKKYPLILNNCKNCNHFQLSYSVDPQILYAKNYTYLSGTGPSMVSHLKKYSNYVIKKTNLLKDNIVVDIGSNDGTCLENFKKKKMRVLGVDPAKKPCQVAKLRGIKSINSFFNKKVAEKITRKYGKVDFVTSHNTLAHVDDIENIFENIFEILKKNGYFCFEIGYFNEVIKNNYFDTIYHEHLDYHHANPLIKFLNKIGFSIIDINIVNIQGGSLRILCKKDFKKKITNKVNKFLKKEERTNLYNKIFINTWEKKIKNLMKDARDKILKVSSKEILYGYGSPTKIILFLKLLNIPKNKLKCIFEDNLLKQNKFLPIYGNKIIGTNFIKKFKPKFIIIFAWNFAKDIRKKINKIDKNIKIIVPLPKFKLN